MQGDADLIPDQGTKIPLAAEQLSLHTVATDPTQSGTRVPQLEKPLRREACAPQWRPSTAKTKSEQRNK